VLRGGYLFERVAAEGDAVGEVTLLGSGAILTEVRKAAQETAAGALHALARAPANRVSIADAGGIPLLVTLFDIADGSDESKEQVMTTDDF
jgi:hypothetical protein